MTDAPNPPFPSKPEEKSTDDKNVAAFGNKKSIEERTLVYARKTADETRKLATWTKILGIFTGIVAAFAIASTIVTTIAVYDAAKSSADQTARMDSTLKEQRAFDSGQLTSMKTQIDDSRKFALQQDTFSNATLDSTGAQIGIAKETMQKQLRAYLYLQPLAPTINGDSLHTDVRVSNFGVTPAFRIADRALLSPNGKARVDTMNGKFDTIPPLPNATLGSVSADIIQDTPMSPESIKLLNSSNVVVAIYIYAEVKYLDIFGKRHFSRIKCWSQWDPKMKVFSNPAFTNDGNYTDDTN